LESVTPITPDSAAHQMPIQARPLPMLGSHGDGHSNGQRAAAGIVHTKDVAYMQPEIQRGPFRRWCPVRRQIGIKMNPHRVGSCAADVSLLVVIHAKYIMMACRGWSSACNDIHLSGPDGWWKPFAKLSRMSYRPTLNHPIPTSRQLHAAPTHLANMRLSYARCTN
jgi:hypothetical protein